MLAQSQGSRSNDSGVIETMPSEESPREPSNIAPMAAEREIHDIYRPEYYHQTSNDEREPFGGEETYGQKLLREY